MVFVDDLKDWGWRHGPSCHLSADTFEELVQFARALRMPDKWIQNKKIIHYDLTERNRKIAVNRGALELSTKELIERARGMLIGQRCALCDKPLILFVESHIALCEECEERS